MVDEAEDFIKGRCNIGVVVVHGVADAQQGANLKTLIENLTKEGRAKGFTTKDHDYNEVHWLKETSPVSGEKVELPVILRRASLGEDRVIFAEVYWADTTRVRAGKLAALLGAFRLVFEMHYFIRALIAQTRNPLSKALAWLLYFAAAIIRGPIAAANVLLLTVASVYLYGEAVLRIAQTQQQRSSDPCFTVIPLRCAVLIVCIGLAVWSLYLFRKNRRERDLAGMEVTLWAGFGAALAAVFMLYGMLAKSPWLPGAAACRPEAPSTASAYAEVIFHVLPVLWGAVSIATMFAFVLVIGLLLISSRSQAKESLWLGLAVVILQVGLWILFISVPSMALLGLAKMEGLELEGVTSVVYGFAFNTLGILLVGASVFWINRLRAKAARNTDLHEAAKAMPRFIIHPIIVFAIVGFGLLMMGLALHQVVSWLRYGSSPSSDDPSIYFALAIAAFVTIVSFALYLKLDSPTAVNFIHIARDLIDHQYRPKGSYTYRLLPLPPDGRPAPDYPRRERLLSRVDLVLNRFKGCDAIVFVAHSQGTIIVFEHLKRALNDADKRRTSVVTFGSPLSHLYEHYFHAYAHISETLSTLQHRGVSWTNLYRVDDPIGNRIGGPRSPIKNELMKKKGGHTGYWSEGEVAKAILGALADVRRARS